MTAPHKNLVSAIVTSYNHAEFLPQRIDSLLHQTHSELEIIVVDDGSDDNSLEILKIYESCPNIRIISLSKNSGYANACNVGVEASNGLFVQFAESDDFSHPKQIETLLESMTNNDVGVSFSRSHIVDDTGAIIGDDFRHRETAFKRLCEKDTIIPGAVIKNFLLNACVIPNMSAALICKDDFISVGGLSSRYTACADWDFWCRMSERCDFFYVAEPFNYFRDHRGSVRSSSSRVVQYSEILDLLNDASRRSRMSILKRIHFKVQLGMIGTMFLSPNPVALLSEFRDLKIKGRMESIYLPFYLMMGTFKRIFLFFTNRFSNVWLKCTNG